MSYILWYAVICCNLSASHMLCGHVMIWACDVSNGFLGNIDQREKEGEQHGDQCTWNYVGK